MEKGMLCVVDGCGQAATALRQVYLSPVGAVCMPHVPLCGAHVRYLTGEYAPPSFNITVKAQLHGAPPGATPKSPDSGGALVVE